MNIRVVEPPAVAIAPVDLAAAERAAAERHAMSPRTQQLLHVARSSRRS